MACCGAFSAGGAGVVGGNHFHFRPFSQTVDTVGNHPVARGEPGINHHFLAVWIPGITVCLLTLLSRSAPRRSDRHCPFAAPRSGPPHFAGYQPAYALTNWFGNSASSLVVETGLQRWCRWWRQFGCRGSAACPRSASVCWCDPRLPPPAFYRLLRGHYGGNVVSGRVKTRSIGCVWVSTTIPVVSPLEIWLPISTCLSPRDRQSAR